jgi:ABC-type multidrug transport system ATPase subunit
MLAIARALMSEPKVLLLDEPSLGLGPRLVKDLFATLRTITARGQSVVLVEQNVPLSLRLADRVHVLENGRLVRSGTPAEIKEDAAIQRAYLGLSGKRPAPAVEPVRHHPGGFVNPFARTVAAMRLAQHQEKAMAGQVASSTGSGFFHPYARSVPAQASSPVPASAQTAMTGEAVRPQAARTEPIPTTGGFVNPGARSPKQ